MDGERFNNSVPLLMGCGVLIVLMGAMWVGGLVQAGERPVEDSGSSSIIGKPVKSFDGSRLGTIADIVVNWHANGYTQYAVLSSGGFLGVGTEYIVVPWAALTPSNNRDYFLWDGMVNVEQGTPEVISYHFYDRSYSAGLRAAEAMTQSLHIMEDNVRSSIEAMRTFNWRLDREEDKDLIVTFLTPQATKASPLENPTE